MTTMVGLYVEFKSKSKEIDDTFRKMNREMSDLKGKQNQVSNGFENMSKRIGTAFKALVGAFAVKQIYDGLSGLIGKMSEVAESIDKVTDAARGLGIPAQSLQRLGYAASLSGVGMTELEGQLKKMNLSIGQAMNGNESMVDSFNKLGLSMSDLQGKDLDQQFLMIAEALGKVQDKNLQAAMGAEIFGRNYTQALSLVRDGITKNVGEFDKLGLALTDSQRAAVDAMGDSQNRLGAIWEGFSQKIVAYVAPAFEKLTTWIGDTITKFGGIDEVAQKFARAIVDGVKWAINALNGLLNTIDGLYARMIKMQIFAKEAAQGASKYDLVSAIYEKSSGTTGGADRQQQRSEDLQGLYKQLQEVEKATSDRKNFLKPVSDLIQSESDKIGTAMTSYIEPIKKAGEATNTFAENAIKAAKGVETAVDGLLKSAGQDKIKEALGLNKNTENDESLNRQIREIFSKSMLGTGGREWSGTFNGKTISGKDNTAAEDLTALESNVRGKFTNPEDSGNLARYMGAIAELKNFVSKIDPSSNKVKVEVDVKASEDFITKVSVSQELQKAMQKQVSDMTAKAAKMGAK